MRSAQKELGEVIRDKEAELNGKKRKQEVVEILMSPKKQSTEPDLKSSQKSGSKSLDAKLRLSFMRMPFLSMLRLQQALLP